MEKRPCRICRRWFTPHPRLGDRQRTCGDSHCKKEWHRKKCAEWNRENAEYFRSNYLHKKLEDVSGAEGVAGFCPARSRFPSGLPQKEVQEVIGVKQFVIIKYLGQLLLRRFQELIRVKVSVRTG
jgi:hypothetical protein